MRHRDARRRTGGDAVMLADALSKGRLNVPNLEGPIADELKSKL